MEWARSTRCITSLLYASPIDFQNSWKQVENIFYYIFSREETIFSLYPIRRKQSFMKIDGSRVYVFVRVRFQIFNLHKIRAIGYGRVSKTLSEKIKKSETFISNKRRQYNRVTGGVVLFTRTNGLSSFPRAYECNAYTRNYQARLLEWYIISWWRI
jgi:hypothetical protein